MENIEDSNVLSIINTNNDINSISISEFLNLQSVKSLQISNEDTITQLKNIKEISINNNNQEKFFYNFKPQTQIFIFNQMKNSQKFFSNVENFSKEFNFEAKDILRIKEIDNNNFYLVVLNSNINIKENHQKIISNKNVKKIIIFFYYFFFSFHYYYFI